jgi:hypothetical protein
MRSRQLRCPNELAIPTLCSFFVLLPFTKSGDELQLI